ncbi:MAG: hypothetical protein ACO1SX_16845 [Actinomycetota bacterium]
MRQALPGAGYATVYRNLGALADEGLSQAIQPGRRECSVRPAH